MEQKAKDSLKKQRETHRWNFRGETEARTKTVTKSERDDI